MCVWVCVVLYTRVCSWKLILHIKFSDVLQLHFATLVSGSSLFLHSDTNLSEENAHLCMCVCVCVCVCVCIGGRNILGVIYRQFILASLCLSA